MPLTTKEREALQSTVGELLWAATQTRPDLAFPAACLAGTLPKTTVKHLVEANRQAKKARACQGPILIRVLSSDPIVVVWTDASLGNLADSGSQAGFVVGIMGVESLGNGPFVPVSWASRRIRRVVRSTFAGETLACVEGIDEGIDVANLLAEFLGLREYPPIVVFTDCKSLFDTVTTTKEPKEKRLKPDIATIREMLETGILKDFVWIPTEWQLADILTKQRPNSLLLQVLSKGRVHIPTECVVIAKKEK